MTPNDQLGGGTVNITYHISAGVPEAVRQEFEAMRPRLKKDAVDAVIEARNRGGGRAKRLGVA